MRRYCHLKYLYVRHYSFIYEQFSFFDTCSIRCAIVKKFMCLNGGKFYIPRQASKIMALSYDDESNKKRREKKGKSRWWNKIKEEKPGEGNSQYNDRKYCLIRLKKLRGYMNRKKS